MAHLFCPAMIQNPTNDNKHIVKNTIYLYLRLFISLSVGLYTSRVILVTLGVEDYGIYNIVSGFVSMLSLFTVSLSGSTSRFITFELGAGNYDRLKETFSTITTLMLILSFVVILLGETVGVWFVNKYLVIPEARWEAAMFCYHCAILTFVVNIVALPYQSLVTAHEHFNFYAIVDIIQSLLRLLIAWMLYISSFDRLITYAMLFLFVSIIVMVIYGMYCSRCFEESRFNLQINKNIFREIAVYSGWITIGASSAVFKEQGVNILINIFYGVMMNAARGVSMQVFAAVNSFSNSLAIAIHPQITKSYAFGDLRRSINLTFVLAKVKGVMIILLALPIVLESDYILHLWLGDIPENAVLFVQWALFLCYARALEGTHSPLFMATGKVRNFQLVGGGVMLLNLPLGYLFLKLGYPAIITMKIGVFMEFVVMYLAFFFLKKMVDFPIVRFYKESIIPQFTVAVSVFFISVFIQSFWHESNLYRFCAVLIVSVGCTLLMSFGFVLNRQERDLIINYVSKKLNRR